MINSGLLGRLKEAKADVERMVSSGQAQDYESYRFFIGRIQGLQDAINILEDLYKRGAE